MYVCMNVCKLTAWPAVRSVRFLFAERSAVCIQCDAFPATSSAVAAAAEDLRESLQAEQLEPQGGSGGSSTGSHEEEAEEAGGGEQGRGASAAARSEGAGRGQGRTRERLLPPVQHIQSNREELDR